MPFINFHVFFVNYEVVLNTNYYLDIKFDKIIKVHFKAIYYCQNWAFKQHSASANK